MSIKVVRSCTPEKRLEYSRRSHWKKLRKSGKTNLDFADYVKTLEAKRNRTPAEVMAAKRKSNLKHYWKKYKEPLGILWEDYYASVEAKRTTKTVNEEEWLNNYRKRHRHACRKHYWKKYKEPLGILWEDYARSRNWDVDEPPAASSLPMLAKTEASFERFMPNMNNLKSQYEGLVKNGLVKCGFNSFKIAIDMQKMTESILLTPEA